MRDLQRYLNPHAAHLLDWLHLPMRWTVLQQPAKGLPEKTSDEEQDDPLRDPVVQELERLKWFLWHGNVYKAFQVVQSIEMDLDTAVATSRDTTARQLSKAVEEFHTYIEHNKGFIPNYGGRIGPAHAYAPWGWVPRVGRDTAPAERRDHTKGRGESIGA